MTSLVYIAAILLVAWSARPRPKAVPWGKWIVVVEPSVFRVAETYVLGPFQKRDEALREARRAISINPHAAATIHDAGVTIFRAGHQLWPATGKEVQ